MPTMQEPINELDNAEAIALCGMILHDTVGAVPAGAFDHPGRRALVAYWERVGRIAAMASDLQAAAKEGGTTDEAVNEGLGDTEAMAPIAEQPARLREAQADLLRRRELRTAQESLRRVEANKGSAAMMAQAWQRVAEAERLSGRMVQDADAGDFGAVLDTVISGLADTHSRGWLGLTLPSFPNLDTKLCGLRGLMLLGAAPGAGKTQLTVQLGIDALSDPDVGLVYLSLEMSKEELGHRLLAMASRLSYRVLRLGDASMQEPGADGLRLKGYWADCLKEGVAQLQELAPRIAMYGSSDIGSMVAGDGDPCRWYGRLATMVEDAKRRRGVKRALVVVDNLQAIAVDPPDGRPWASDMDRDRVVIEGLTRLQHDLADPVLVVSEVAKGKFRDTDDQGAILGTGRNSYRSDVVMLLKRCKDADGKDTKDGRVDLIVDKGRDGMVRGTVQLEWTDDYARLEEVNTGVRCPPPERSS